MTSIEPAVEQQAASAAEEFRKAHGLGVQPLGDLVTLIEQTTGHEVAVLDADPDEHGMTMYDPARDRAFIGVARTPHPMRHRSTLAHELAHLVFQDQSEQLTVRPSAEIRADAFARHLLVPAEGVRTLLRGVHAVDESALSRVVQRYLVSPAIAAIAMRDAGFIDAKTTSRWRSVHTRYLATRFGWSDFYAALQDETNRVRAPQKLVSRAVAGYEAGVISVEAMATLRGVSVDTARADLAAIGAVPGNADASQFDLVELPNVEVDLSCLEDGPPSS